MSPAENQCVANANTGNIFYSTKLLHEHDRMEQTTQLSSRTSDSMDLEFHFNKIVKIGHYLLSTNDTFSSDTLFCSGAIPWIPLGASETATPNPGQATSNKSVPFPHAYFLKSPYIQQKAEGYSNFRGELVLRFVANSLPTISGKVWFFVDLFPELTGSRCAVREADERGGERTRYTGYHGVELDFSHENDAELVIPFVHPQSSFRLTQPEHIQAVLHAIPLTKVRTEGTKNVNIDVYAYYRNVQLTGPTPNKLDASLTDINSFISRTVSSVEIDTYDEHSGMDVEQNHKSQQGVSTSMVGEVMKSALKLGEAMFPRVGTALSWARKIANGVTSVIGHSVPTSLQAVSPVTLSSAKGYTQVEGLDNSTRLGPTQDGGIASTARFGMKEDEMLISHATSKYQILKTGTYATNSIIGDRLCVIPVSPMECDADTVGNQKIFHVTNAGYVASMFQQWRGGITYCISLAKTKFHGGRIRVTWLPDGLIPTDTEFDVTVSHTRIYNIANDSIIEFTVPWMQPVDALPCKVPTSTFDENNGTQWKHTNGVILITADTPLINASTVASTIDFVVWAKGSNLQFLYPSFTEYCPIFPDSLETDARQQENSQRWKSWGAGVDRKVETDSYIQHSAATVEEFDEQVTTTDHKVAEPDPVTGSTDIAPIDTSLGEAVFGEHMLSLLSLIKRFGPFFQYTADPSYSQCGSSIVFDTANFARRDTTTLSPDTHRAMRSTQIPPLWYVSHMYRFYAGSVRYKAFSTDSTRSIRARVCREHNYSKINGNTGTISAFDESYAAGFEQQQRLSEKGVLEIEVPYARPRPISLVSNGYISSGNSRPSVAISMVGREMRNWRTNNSTSYIEDGFDTIQMFTAAGDDFHFGMIIGAPAISKRSGNFPQDCLLAYRD